METILSISGKPGLYRLVSRGKMNLIVESIDESKRRVPAFSTITKKKFMAKPSQMSIRALEYPHTSHTQSLMI
jgi:hypothetical protein